MQQVRRRPAGPQQQRGLCVGQVQAGERCDSAELGARRFVDVGCGTGLLVLVLAPRGLRRRRRGPDRCFAGGRAGKPGAQRVRWIEGDATRLPVTDRDLATITGNAAQAVADPQQWTATLTGIRAALRPGDHLRFETRGPAARGWQRWTKEATYRTNGDSDVGAVTSWIKLSALDWQLVSFHWTWIVDSDGATLASDFTLRFRERDEADRHAAGYQVIEVRDAPDRPGREFLFLAVVRVPRGGPRPGRQRGWRPGSPRCWSCRASPRASAG